MPFYTSEQILNQAFDSESGTMKTSNDQLGTPGTSEPAHAGGSTGLIGWARDILAKIANFGTAAAPSADVLSVQYPTPYVGKATLGALNSALTVDTLGATQIAFNSPQTTPGGFQIIFEGTNSNATTPVWAPLRYVSEGTAGPIYSSPGSTVLLTGYTARVDCAGVTQVRVRCSVYGGSGSWEVLAHRIYSPGLIPTVNEPSNTSSNPIYIIPGSGAYYTDSSTPLGTSASFTGSSRTMTVGNNSFNALYIADQASIGSAATIQGSSDAGSTWRAHAVGTQTAGTPVPLRAPRTVATYRLVFSNGPTGQGFFSATSSQTPT